MSDGTPSRVERILELLLEELEERQRAREAPIAASEEWTAEGQLTPAPRPEEAPVPDMPEAVASAAAETDETPVPCPPIRSHAARMLSRLALGLLVAVVVINIPLTRHGLTLATAMPDSRSMVIRDGLVVTEAGQDEIYVYQGGQFRWISSLDAFEHYGFTWADVHEVEDGFLNGFELGPPLHVLLKCATSPHIYRLEAGTKRWIVDIAAFEAEGHVWEDVRDVPCQRLRDLPDGETIPPGQGPAPQP